MNTLELTLQRKTDSGYPVIAALTRPGGFLPLRREGMLNLGIPALTELQYEPLAYGTALGQALFVDEIRDTFREGLSGGEALRVLLSIEAPDLRALDWHRLAAPFDGRWRLLASQQNTPFSLAVPSSASAHFPAIGRRDLRALVFVAGPESLSGDYKLAPFDVAATLASIQAALGDIPCDVLQNPSLDTLCTALTATPYTLLHLVCHGAVNQNGETILYFPKDDRRSPTPAADLFNRLGSLARLPHFAFISVCESALPKNGLGSLAERLVRKLGLPAVLAMTDRVSIATAGDIAKPFYAHLYQHGQPDLALAQSLAGLQGKHDLTVPALFSRLGGQPLFGDETYVQDQVLQSYLTVMRDRNRYLETGHFTGQSVEFRQAFSMLWVCELKPEKPGEAAADDKKPVPISFDKMIQQETKVVLLGEAGSGKSTLLQSLALETAEKSLLAPGASFIPVLVRLRNYAGTQRLDDFLKAQLYLDYVPETVAQLWLETGRLWVLLDGLDEVDLSHRHQVVQAIQKFIYTPYGENTHLIVTSRVAGYSEYRLISTAFVHFELQTLRQPAEVQAFLTSWLAALQREGREQASQKAKQFLELIQAQNNSPYHSSTPLLLQLAANTYTRSGEVVIDRSRLYQEYIKSLLEQAEARQPTPYRFFRAQAELGLESIAWLMQTQQIREVERLSEALNQANHSLDGRELMRYLNAEVGLLRVEPANSQGQEIYGFAHQSYQEFLVGKRLAAHWKQNAEQTWLFLKVRLHHYSWRDPILFMAAQLDIDSRTQLVHKILAAKSLYENALCRDFLLAAAICRTAPVSQSLQSSVAARLERLFQESTFRYRDGAGFDLGDRLLVIPVSLAVVGAFFVSWHEMPTSLGAVLSPVPQFILLALVLSGIFMAAFMGMADGKLRWLVNPITAAFGRHKFSLLHERIKALQQGNLQTVVKTENSFKISDQTQGFLSANGIAIPPGASEEEILKTLRDLEVSKDTLGYLFAHLKNNYVEYWDDRSPDVRPIAEEAIRLLVYFGARFDKQTNLKIAQRISYYLTENWSTLPEVAYQAIDQIAGRLAELEVAEKGE